MATPAFILLVHHGRDVCQFYRRDREMLFDGGAWRSLSHAVFLVLFVGTTYAQEKTLIRSYFDPVQGVSANETVRRALATNGELAAARLEIEQARARLRQAGLRPNPTIDVEQTTGRF